MNGPARTVDGLNDDGARGGIFFAAGEDGEIKGPGPFGPMALMVLEKFRDLTQALGPELLRSLSLIRGLSGTLAQSDRYV